MHLWTSERFFSCCEIWSSNNTYDADSKPSSCQRFVFVTHPWIYLNFRSAAAACFINLVIKESDNNVKLIVLDRLDSLRSKHGHVLDALIMDILQILARCCYVPLSLVCADLIAFQCWSGCSPQGNWHSSQHDIEQECWRGRTLFEETAAKDTGGRLWQSCWISPIAHPVDSCHCH